MPNEEFDPTATELLFEEMLKTRPKHERQELIGSALIRILERFAESSFDATEILLKTTVEHYGTRVGGVSQDAEQNVLRAMSTLFKAAREDAEERDAEQPS